MAALAEQHYGRLYTQQQPRPDDFAPYPSPPSNAFVASPPLDVGVTGEAGYAYSGTTTCLGFQPSLYAETTNYIINSQASPGAYAEDGDMRLSSSGLSSGSLPSAPSSVIGSPQSNNGQLGVSDWSNNAINVQPGIVGSDFIPGAEYYMQPGMEEFATFDFGQPKSFIGKLIFGDSRAEAGWLSSNPPLLFESFPIRWSPPSPFFQSRSRRNRTKTDLSKIEVTASRDCPGRPPVLLGVPLGW